MHESTEVTSLGNALENRLNGLIQITNAALFLMISVFVIHRLTTLGLAQPPWPAILSLLLTGGNLAYAGLGGSPERSAWMTILILMLGLGLSGWNTGAFFGPTVLMSPLLPILATLLIGSSAGWLVAASTAFLLSALYVAQANGLVNPNPQSDESLLTVRYLATLATVLVSSLVVWEFSRMKRQMLQFNQKQAVTDHLTGLYNRRYFEAALQQELARAGRNDSWLSLIIADVDHFKRYNDTNGHQAGDRCLAEVAQVLQRAVRRPSDVVSRFGGEEFVLLLPDTDRNGARRVAESVREFLGQRALPCAPASRDMVTMTLGVASVRGIQLASGDRLLGEADQALYRGKASGRDRVVSVVLKPEVQGAFGNVIPFSA